MINKELFYVLMKLPRNIKLKPAPRLVATPKAMAANLLDKGFAHEFYSPDGKARHVSWFWRSGDIIIPTSPYSNLKLSDDGEFSYILYGDMIRKLREEKPLRDYYRDIRRKHNQAIVERINDIRKLSPLENYVKLLETKPWVFDSFNEDLIASYLNIKIEVLKRFMSHKA